MTLRFRTFLWLGLLLFAASPVLAQQIRTESFRDREVVSQEIIVRFRGATANQRQPASVEDPDISSITAVGSAGAVRLRSRGRNVEALIRAYANRSDVEYAEPNYVWKARDVPNDPSLKYQWALQNTGQKVGTSTGIAGADIHAVAAWDITEGSRDIVVGVIDTGIDYTHPDLSANIWSAPSAFTVTISGRTITCPAGSHGFDAILWTCDPMDREGHGTHLAGIIGAAGNNGHIGSGVSRVANMMSLRFLNVVGQGSTADAIAAIEFAVQVKARFPTAANVRVLNASWGGDNFSQALLDEINRAGANGMLLVTGAGNDGADRDALPDYPANYAATNILVAAATDSSDRKVAFSSYGASSVDLGAPGDEIFSTDLQASFTRKSGTSASAAFASGAAALVLSKCSLNTAVALKSNLMSSVDAIPDLAGITVTGGRLNVNSAIQNCAGTPPTFAVTATPRGQVIALGHLGEFTVPVTPLNGFSDSVTLAVTNAPAGMSAVFNPETVSNGSTTLNIATDSTVADGTYFLNIVATGGGITRTTGVIVKVGLSFECTLGTAQLTHLGNFRPSDGPSLHDALAFARYCSLTLADDMALRIVSSTQNFASSLYVWSSSGDVIASVEGSNGGVIQRVLNAGNYIIEVATADPGELGTYSIVVNRIAPTLTSLTPTSGLQNTSVSVTLTGNDFIGSPFLVNVSGCQGGTVSDIVVVSPTLAHATLNLPNIFGVCNITVSTPGGSSLSRPFSVLPPAPQIAEISPTFGVQGQLVPITITGTNFLGIPDVRFHRPDGSSSPLGEKSVTPTTITVDVFLSTSSTEPGVYGFTVTAAGGTSAKVPFTVVAAPPSITGMDPIVGGPGVSTQVNIFGTNFRSPFQINVAPQIQVSNAAITAIGWITATFTVDPNAALGAYPVTVTTDGGTSAPFVFTLIAPPTISAITPQRAFLGRTTTVTLTGTNFVCLTRPLITGTDVTVNSVPSSGACSPTSKSITVQVPPTAQSGPRTITLTGPNGTSNPMTIDIVPVPPIIQSITPAYSTQGTNVVVTVSASDLHLAPVGVNISGTGVQILNTSINGSILTATISIAGTAPVGVRNFSITNSQGESDPVIFSITPPTWPDLTVRQSLPSPLYSGFNETLTFTVRNDGTNGTTQPITVASTLLQLDAPAALENSQGWICSTSFRSLSCTSSIPLAVNAETVLAIKLAAPVLLGGFSSTVEVNSPEDFNFSNNKVTNESSTVNPPSLRLVLLPQTLQAGQQGSLSIELTQPFRHEIASAANEVAISFSSSAGIPMDPAVQFATGGQTGRYVIRANTVQAEVAGLPGPIGFQTGTLQGTLAFRATYQAGSRPPVTVTTSGNIPPTRPVLTKALPEKTSNGFVAAVTLFSPARQVSALSFQFNTTTPMRFSCGGMSGCTASGSTLTLNVQNIFSTWYAGNTAFGSLATIRVPFVFDATLSGSVTVTATESSLTSNSMTFELP